MPVLDHCRSAVLTQGRVMQFVLTECCYNIAEVASMEWRSAAFGCIREAQLVQQVQVSLPHHIRPIR